MKVPSPLLRWWVTGITSAVLLCAIAFTWKTLHKSESTLAIRPAAQHVTVPDGFAIWHHLDANGIHFKSITPQNDTLLIKFESSAQSAAAKEVLDRTLPHRYIIAAQDDDKFSPAWLNRLRNSTRRFG